MANILLIEDEEVLAETLEIVLMKAGHNVTLAANGLIGAKKFAEVRPDLVITDIIMPEQEGLDTIRQIREIDTTVPIIAYSGGGRTKNFDFLRLADKFGATDVLRKPFSNDELLTLVAHCLNKKAKQ
jgi:DNA-binding response OmpR family regulator